MGHALEEAASPEVSGAGRCVAGVGKAEFGADLLDGAPPFRDGVVTSAVHGGDERVSVEFPHRLRGV